MIQITGVSTKKAPYLLNCRLLNSRPAKLCQNCFQEDLFMQRSIPESKNKWDKNPFVKFRIHETSGESLEGEILGSYIFKHRLGSLSHNQLFYHSLQLWHHHFFWWKTSAVKGTQKQRKYFYLIALTYGDENISSMASVTWAILTISGALFCLANSQISVALLQMSRHRRASPDSAATCKGMSHMWDNTSKCWGQSWGQSWATTNRQTNPKHAEHPVQEQCISGLPYYNPRCWKTKLTDQNQQKQLSTSPTPPPWSGHHKFKAELFSVTQKSKVKKIKGFRSISLIISEDLYHNPGSWKRKKNKRGLAMTPKNSVFLHSLKYWF